ncbi:hypothetical protein QBC47DRAFT_368114 [Echria macrotheca]|uniref:BZIP domain-containing protein n=1 Tax=Echria macrotheca TaxID=438768 RepID=A0AAJ0FB46_9PEZI|nr:hypothetical protein QBC47DRAFT_368114 [Echria macrotheca]
MPTRQLLCFRTRFLLYFSAASVFSSCNDAPRANEPQGTPLRLSLRIRLPERPFLSPGTQQRNAPPSFPSAYSFPALTKTDNCKDGEARPPPKSRHLDLLSRQKPDYRRPGMLCFVTSRLFLQQPIPLLLPPSEKEVSGALLRPAHGGFQPGHSSVCSRQPQVSDQRPLSAERVLPAPGRAEPKPTMDVPMDTSSQFFNDCLDFGDPNAYASPGQELVDGGGDMLSFHQPDYTQHGLNGSPLPPDEHGMEHRLPISDWFSGSFDSVAPDQKQPLFVDPGLYGVEGEDEDEDEDEEDSDGTKAQIQVLSEEVSPASSRRTSRTKSGSHRTSQSASTPTDITPPDEESPKRRRKTKKTVKTPGKGGEDSRKRSKFLERNRIAASKCREKKKQYVSSLEGTKLELEAHNVQLQMEYSNLLAEVGSLKHHLMAHAKCNDPNIDRWLNNEARRFVQTPTDPFAQPYGGLAQPTPTVVSVESPRSRNPSIASTYQAMQSVTFEGLPGPDRQGSISYSHNKDLAPLDYEVPHSMCAAPTLYASPSDSAFQCVNSPHPKREPDINYNHMPDNMFNPDTPAYVGG